MGCDIHIVLERRKKPDGKWIGVYTTDTHPGGRIKIAQRDYGFFAEVASVRGNSESGKYPRNVPEDVSELAWQEYMRTPTEHHSASHMTLAEFGSTYLKMNPNAAPPDRASYDLFGTFDSENEFDYRVVNEDVASAAQEVVELVKAPAR